MKKYYVEYVEKGGRQNRTEHFMDFQKAFETYLVLLEVARGTCWAEEAYKTTKIITVCC